MAPTDSFIQTVNVVNTIRVTAPTGAARIEQFNADGTVSVVHTWTSTGVEHSWTPGIAIAGRFATSFQRADGTWRRTKLIYQLNSNPLLTKTAPLSVVPAGSIWRADLTNAPVDPVSSTVVANLPTQIVGYSAIGFNYGTFDQGYFETTNATPKLRVGYYDAQAKGYAQTGTYSDSGTSGYFENVPIPDYMIPAAGTDNEVGIYNSDTDQLWEFWKMGYNQHGIPGWSAAFGGRIDNASQSNVGHFPIGWGATAAEIPTLHTMVTLNDIASGVIDHCVGVDLKTGIAGTHWWPAQNHDTPTGGQLIEGMRLRLKPGTDLSTLHPIAQMIGIAAMKYGWVVTDTAGLLVVIAENLTHIQNATGSNPWGQYLNGTPGYNVMLNFPYSQFEIIQKDYLKSTYDGPASTATYDPDVTVATY